MDLKDIVILYHANCPDGFGAAFAAWKKFGESASYVPVEHGKPYPKGLEGKEVYICDFSYPDGMLLEIEQKAKQLMVFDHHASAQKDVEAMHEHIFDMNRSGAGITWDYFHPEKKRPGLINYVEEGDLYRNTLPNTREILAYLYVHPYDFETWDRLMEQLENPKERMHIVVQGATYSEHYDLLAEKIARGAMLVSFEGYECYLATASEVFVTRVGHILNTKKPPLALIVRAKADRISVSMRSDGSVDVAKIAQKYGGGGHPGAATFRLEYGEKVPWAILEQ